MKYDKNYTSLIEQIDRLNCVKVRNEYPNIVTITKGYILPRKISKTPYQGIGGVLDENRNFIDECLIYDLPDLNKKKKIAFGGSYAFNTYDVVHKKVIYMGLAHQQWGHFLIDVVQRAWCISKDEYKDYYYVFSSFNDEKTNFKKNYLDFYKLLGINTEKIIFVSNPTLFDEIIVSSPSIYPGNYVSLKYKEMIDTVILNALKLMKNKNIEKNIYFSRTKLKDNKELGENKLEELFEKLDIKILYPEELSLWEQIFYWQTSSNIFCIGGSIPHNIVFAKKDSNVFILNKMSKLYGYQFTLDVIQEPNVIYVDVFKEPYKRFPIDLSRGPFWICLTDKFKSLIFDLFNYEIDDDKITVFQWILYLKMCLLVEVKYIFRGKKQMLKSCIYHIKRRLK